MKTAFRNRWLQIGLCIFGCIVLLLGSSHSGWAYPGSPAGDFKVKGFYVDCRTEVLTVAAIKALAADLSQKGINALLIEYEATFPFRKNATLCNRYAYTQAEIKELVAYCASLGIEIIPLQNCFGHCEYILRHDRYSRLREDKKEVSQVCPLKIAEAQQVFGEIFREVAELHPSKYFHIGADETYLLGDCKRCAEVAAEKDGKSRLFVNYIKAMCQLVSEMGKTPVIWADMILKYPEALHELPDNLIFIDWNYGWEPDYFGKLDRLLSSGAEVWGAPSLRSSPDNLYLTQWMKHFSNLTTFVPFARNHGYKGMIETSWSTSGTYGFHYDTWWEVVSMHPVRYVYPMSGFRILADAYCEALRSSEPLDPVRFIAGYAEERYGLSAAGSKILLEYFSMPQETVGNGKDAKGKPVGEVIEECRSLKTKMDKLAPRYNKEEFEHFRFMLDLRIHYLAFKEIESCYQSDRYTAEQAPDLIKRLKVLFKEAALLDKRFIRMNKTYLKEPQLEEINTWRNEKMNEMYRALLSQL